MKELEEFKDKKHNDVLRSMISYMDIEKEDAEFDCGYKQKDIDKCGAILDVFIDDLISSAKENKLIMKAVKKTVKALNTLNNKCDSCIIETDQREDICSFIHKVSFLAGLIQTDDDITYEWRTW